MKKYLVPAILSCVICALLAVSAAAQSSGNEGKNEFSVWGGFSPNSTNLIKGTARTSDARLGIFSVRYARRFNNNDTINLRYTLDVIPIAILSYPDYNYVRTSPTSYQRVSAMRSTRYAFGISPLGLRGNFRPRKKIQPYLDGSVGLLFFNKAVPNFIGVKLGFTAHIGGGIEYNLKNGKAIDFGYKYFHISNGNRGLENPGFDNNLFYVGYTFSKK